MEYAVAKWASYFEVSTSGYYSWLQTREKTAKRKAILKAAIRNIFEESHGTYGPERVRAKLRDRGLRAGRPRVAAYMAEMGLHSIHNRNKTRSLTNSKKARGKGYPNLMRKETVTKPREAVCSDITYIKTAEGYDYLCVIKDVVSGDILGEVQSERMTKELVIQTFLQAQARHNLPKGIIFHNDRGSQYTSRAFMEMLKAYGVRQSFSRVGMPGDNAWAESFFATLKKECVRWHPFQTREEARQDIFAYIEGFYNSDRIQKRLGYLSPREYWSGIKKVESKTPETDIK